VNQRRNQPQYE